MSIHKSNPSQHRKYMIETAPTQKTPCLNPKRIHQNSYP